MLVHGGAESRASAPPTTQGGINLGERQEFTELGTSEDEPERVVRKGARGREERLREGDDGEPALKVALHPHRVANYHVS